MWRASGRLQQGAVCGGVRLCVRSRGSARVSLKNAHVDPGWEKRGSFHHMEFVPQTQPQFSLLHLPASLLYKERAHIHLYLSLSPLSCVAWELSVAFAPTHTETHTQCALRQHAGLCLKGQPLISHNGSILSWPCVMLLML